MSNPVIGERHDRQIIDRRSRARPLTMAGCMSSQSARNSNSPQQSGGSGEGAGSGSMGGSGGGSSGY